MTKMKSCFVMMMLLWVACMRSDAAEQPERKGWELCPGVYWWFDYRTLEDPPPPALPFKALMIDGYGFHASETGCSVFAEDGTRLFSVSVWQHADRNYMIADILLPYYSDPYARKRILGGVIIQTKEEFSLVMEISGFFNDLAESEEEMRKYLFPGRPSLYIYCYRDYCMAPTLDILALSPERMKELLKKWIDTQRGVLKADNNPKEVARRRELYQKRCREATEKREYHTQQKAESEWNKESRKNDVIRIRWYPDSDGRNMAELLKIPVPKIHNTIPNINAGTACGSVSSLFGKKGYRPEEAEGGNDALRATFNNGKNRIHYLIYHAFNRHDAIYAMCAWPCYDGRLRPRNKTGQPSVTAKDMAKNLVKTEKLVGDLALYEWPRLDGNGALPPGRVQSAVWFVRGNTAVAIVSEDPYVDILPYARAVDKELQKKAGAAAGTARKKE